MKLQSLLYAVLIIFLFQGCNFKSKHPQAEIADEAGDTGIDDKSVLRFSAGVDRNISNFKKEYSLVYMSGDLSLYAEKYSRYSNGMLYRTYSANGTTSDVTKSYYFKNDSLILVKESSRFLNGEGQVLKDTRTYLRNNVTFKIDSRTASSEEAIHTLPYLSVQPADNKYPTENYINDIKAMDDAIRGTDKFEMVFQNITTYPDSRYIILKSKHPGNYTASILVKNNDPLIDSLVNMTSVFKDEKLKFKWKVVDNEAVYVPVADTITSASGENK